MKPKAINEVDAAFPTATAEAKESHGEELVSGNTALLVVNVENVLVGLSLTESGPAPFEMRRITIELRDVEALKRMAEFLRQQIKRMETQD